MVLRNWSGEAGKGRSNNQGILLAFESKYIDVVHGGKSEGSCMTGNDQHQQHRRLREIVPLVSKNRLKCFCSRQFLSC